jgi:hypothetical protein
VAIESVTADAGAGGASFGVDTITGSVQVPYVKLMSGADAAEDLISGDAANGLDVDVTRVSGTVAVSNAGLTELAAAINASSQMDVNIAASGATVPVSNAGLTELAGAINASAQMDVNIAASGATVPISHTALTELAAAIDTELQVDIVGALPAGTNAIGKLAANSGVDIGDVDVASVAGNVTVVQGTAANLNATVVGTGTFVVQAALSAGTNTNEVVGDIAHGTAVGGNPVQVGFEGRSTDMTAVDSGDVVRGLATLVGKQVNLPFAVPGATWSYASPAAVADTADDEAKAAGAAGVRHYITSVQVFNADDSVGTEVVIKDGSSVLWRGWAEQTGGGCSAVFTTPLRGTAATAVNVANITTSAETYFNLQGFSASE